MSTRVVAIDVGNTRLKWGVHDGVGWQARGVMETGHIAADTSLRAAVESADIGKIQVSNVAGVAVAAALREHLAHALCPPVFIRAQKTQCGVTNHYQHGAALGSDRWAALISAHLASAHAPRAQLVVMAGTALTIDALTADGQFLGGVIVPGPALMLAALNKATAQLPAADGGFQWFPQNTADALTSGARLAGAGAICLMHRQLSERVGATPHCVAAGGGFNLLAPHLPFPVAINDNLVLEGVIAIARDGVGG